jgi:DNA-binding transcriptional ArsR family regulator
MQLPEYNRFLNTLSNEKRLKIIDLLRNGPKTVSGIYTVLGFEQSTTSRHLNCLQRCGFVFVKPDGPQRIYSLNKETILPLLKLIDKHTHKYCRELGRCDENAKQVRRRKS